MSTKTEPCEGLIAPGSMRAGASFFVHSVHCPGCTSADSTIKERNELWGAMATARSRIALLERLLSESNNRYAREVEGCLSYKALVDESKEPCYDCIAAAERIAELEREYAKERGLVYTLTGGVFELQQNLTSMRTLAGELAEIVKHYRVLVDGTDAIKWAETALTKAKELGVSE